MKKTPPEMRAEVIAMCQAYAAAVSTGNAYVVNATATAIEAVDLPRLIPDRPTLESVINELKR